MQNLFEMWIVDDLLNFFKKNRFSLEDEKTLQAEIALKLATEDRFPHRLPYLREFRLDDHSIIDFLVNENIGIEVKLKGSAMSIFRQCERYCQFPAIEALILLTNKSMALPPEINGKPCFVQNLSEAWL
jgi:hypothetical protein